MLSADVGFGTHTGSSAIIRCALTMATCPYVQVPFHGLVPSETNVHRARWELVTLLQAQVVEQFRPPLIILTIRSPVEARPKKMGGLGNLILDGC
jgi:hypothetical protein